MVQATIYDLARQQKHEGMERSYLNSDSEWRKAVNERMTEIMSSKETFTADDVIIPLDERGIFTRDNRALGAIFTAYARTGLIENTRTQVVCKRKKRNNGYVTVWRVK